MIHGKQGMNHLRRQGFAAQFLCAGGLMAGALIFSSCSTSEGIAAIQKDHVMEVGVCISGLAKDQTGTSFENDGYPPLIDWVVWIETPDSQFVKTVRITRQAVNVKPKIQRTITWDSSYVDDTLYIHRADGSVDTGITSTLHATADTAIAILYSSLRRITHLPVWREKSRPDSLTPKLSTMTSAVDTGKTYLPFDGIASASVDLKTPRDTVVQSSWDFTDSLGLPVPTGDYVVCAEVACFREDEEFIAEADSVTKKLTKHAVSRVAISYRNGESVKTSTTIPLAVPKKDFVDGKYIKFLAARIKLADGASAAGIDATTSASTAQ